MEALTDRVLIVGPEHLPILADLLANRINSPRDRDPLLTPVQLHERQPSLSVAHYKRMIRGGKYGRKIGEKGSLAARESEVIKYEGL